MKSAKGASLPEPPPRPLFSPRETQIAVLLITYPRTKEIADQIGITEQAVKNSLSRMFKKAAVSNRYELRAYCIERGLHVAAGTRLMQSCT